MPMKQPSRTHMTGAGDAMTGIAARKIATIAKGFIDMILSAWRNVKTHPDIKGHIAG